MKNRILPVLLGILTALAAIYLYRHVPSLAAVEVSRVESRLPAEDVAYQETNSAEVIWDAPEPEFVELAGTLESAPLKAAPADAQLLDLESAPAADTFPADAFAIRPDETNLFDPVDQTRPVEPVPHAEGNADKSLRSIDFPHTYISAIHVDLTSPDHWVELTWTGPQAARMETGPFHSSPGAGLGNNDCDDAAESNRDGSNCTPKGSFAVEAFSDFLPSYPHCRFVTWFNIPRAVAFHSHSQVPSYPASHGCVRLDRYAAQLIHNNSLIGKTEVTVDGTWSR